MHSNDNHDAYDYAERIRERLPRRLRKLRDAMGLINAPQPHESHFGSFAKSNWQQPRSNTFFFSARCSVKAAARA